MNLWTSLPEWRNRRRALGGRSVGFVPTMGALHDGHASLVERCRGENQVTLVSIFVNPTQFNDPGDLDRYPRTMESDLALLDSIGVDEVIAPPVCEMYPPDGGLRIAPDPAHLVLEGEYRPGFLQGMLTVVLKLLNLAAADRAYFGEKDFQQLRAVRHLVREFFVDTEIVACPTVREASGLAMSSRNRLLSDAGRAKAPALYRALVESASPGDARASLEAAGFLVEYVEDRWGRRLAAAFLDGVRLIDNVALAL